MKHAAAPRVAGEVCTLLLLYCLFDPIPPRFWLLAAFPVALLVCGIVAMRFDLAVLRLLCCLPAALPLLAADRSATLILLAVCWLYAAIRFTVGRFTEKDWVYRREFAVLIAIAVLSSLLVAAGKTLHVETPPGVIGFAAASVLLGIYSMRVIRLGTLDEPGWCAYSALELVLPLGVAAGFSALLWLLLQAVYSVLLWLAGLFGEAPAPAPTQTAPNPDNPLIHYIPHQFPAGGGQYVLEELPDPVKKPEPEPERVMQLSYAWLILIIAVLALAALLIILYLRRRKKVNRKNGGAGENEETEFSRFGRRRQRVVLSADRRIRAAYRSYLRELQQQGLSIHSCDTSLDVLTAAEVKGLSPEARELRELYLIARYGDADSLGPKEADRAVECLQIIQNTG